MILCLLSKRDAETDAEVVTLRAVSARRSEESSPRAYSSNRILCTACQPRNIGLSLRLARSVPVGWLQQSGGVCRKQQLESRKDSAGAADTTWYVGTYGPRCGEPVPVQYGRAGAAWE